MQNLIAHPIWKRTDKELRVYLAIQALSKNDILENAPYQVAVNCGLDQRVVEDLMRSLAHLSLIRFSGSTASTVVSQPEENHPSPNAPAHLRRKKQELVRCPWLFADEPCNVFCTTGEWELLRESLGDEQASYLTEQLHDYLNNFISDTGKWGAKAKTYKDHYLTIKNWRRLAVNRGQVWGKHPTEGWGFWKPWLLEARP